MTSVESTMISFPIVRDGRARHEKASVLLCTLRCCAVQNTVFSRLPRRVRAGAPRHARTHAGARRPRLRDRTVDGRLLWRRPGDLARPTTGLGASRATERFGEEPWQAGF